MEIVAPYYYLSLLIRSYIGGLIKPHSFWGRDINSQGRQILSHVIMHQPTPLYPHPKPYPHASAHGSGPPARGPIVADEIIPCDRLRRNM